MGNPLAEWMLCLGALLLWGCAGSIPPPVLDRSVSDIPADGIHEVSAGDTLYAIAFRYGRDFRALADINDIDEPYLIRIGQRLRLAQTRRRSNPPAPAAGQAELDLARGR